MSSIKNASKAKNKVVNKACAAAPDSTASGNKCVNAVHSSAPAAKLSKKSVLVLRKRCSSKAANSTLPKPASAVVKSVAQAGWMGMCSMRETVGE